MFYDQHSNARITSMCDLKRYYGSCKRAFSSCKINSIQRIFNIYENKVEPALANSELITTSFHTYILSSLCVYD